MVYGGDCGVVLMDFEFLTGVTWEVEVVDVYRASSIDLLIYVPDHGPG